MRFTLLVCVSFVNQRICDPEQISTCILMAYISSEAVFVIHILSCGTLRKMLKYSWSKSGPRVTFFTDICEGTHFMNIC